MYLIFHIMVPNHYHDQRIRDPDLPGHRGIAERTLNNSI